MGASLTKQTLDDSILVYSPDVTPPLHPPHQQKPNPPKTRTFAGALFSQLVDLLRFYAAFPIHDHTGDALPEEAVTSAHYERLQALQRLFFKHVPKLRELSLANCGALEKRDVLARELKALTPEELAALVTRQLRLLAPDDPWAGDPAFLTEVVIAAYERRKPLAETVNAMPLYPTEAVLCDAAQVPSVHYTGERGWWWAGGRGRDAWGGGAEGTLGVHSWETSFLGHAFGLLASSSLPPCSGGINAHQPRPPHPTLHPPPSPHPRQATRCWRCRS